MLRSEDAWRRPNGRNRTAQRVLARKAAHLWANSSVRALRSSLAAERLLLHVAVARAGNSAGRQRDLHQPGAVDARVGLAAPQVGSVQEHLGELGPLVPQEVLQKTDQYMKETEQWMESLKQLSELDSRVAMDAFALADLGISLKDLQKGLDQCNAAM